MNSSNLKPQKLATQIWPLQVGIVSPEQWTFHFPLALAYRPDLPRGKYALPFSSDGVSTKQIIGFNWLELVRANDKLVVTARTLMMITLVTTQILI